jgi:hypothetical protein
MVLLAVVILVPLGGWYFWGPSGANLTSLNETNIAQFKAQFDVAAGERVLVLVSPT